jgi:hypothetical protein
MLVRPKAVERVRYQALSSFLLEGFVDPLTLRVVTDSNGLSIRTAMYLIGRWSNGRMLLGAP